MDSLSKNQLIDLVVDLARAELGEDTDDDAILAWLLAKIGPTWAARKDRPVDLVGKREQRLRVLASHRERGWM